MLYFATTNRINRLLLLHDICDIFLYVFICARHPEMSHFMKDVRPQGARGALPRARLLAGGEGVVIQGGAIKVRRGAWKKRATSRPRRPKSKEIWLRLACFERKTSF